MSIKIQFKVGELVRFNPQPNLFNLFYDDIIVETKFAIILKVRNLLKTADILIQTENKILKDVSFSEIEKII